MSGFWIFAAACVAMAVFAIAGVVWVLVAAAVAFANACEDAWDERPDSDCIGGAGLRWVDDPSPGAPFNDLLHPPLLPDGVQRDHV